MKRLKLLGLLGAALAIAGVAQAQQSTRVPPPPPPTTQRAAPPSPVARKPDSAGSQAMHANPMAMVPLRSDLAVKGGITIGSGAGVSGAWGGMISVPGSLGKLNVVDCVFPIAYTVQNPGAIATGSYANKVVANSGAWFATQIQPGPVLGKGASQTMHTWLKLKPSSGNTILLQLDSGNQVSEQNENNNQVQIQVTVNGPCQP